MQQKVYQLLNMLIPSAVKRFLVLFVLEKHSLLNFLKHYYFNRQADKKIRLIFGADYRKSNYISVSYSSHSDIKLSLATKIFFPNESIDQVIIDNFINQLSSRQEIHDFIYQVVRIMKKGSTLTIKLPDSNSLITQLARNKTIPAKPINYPLKYIFNTRLDIFNYHVFDHCQSRYFFNRENLHQLLSFFNLEKKSVTLDANLNLIAVYQKPKQYQPVDLANKLPSQKSVTEDIPVYLFNCDPLYSLNALADYPKSKLNHQNFASVIGSYYFLNLIPIIRPKHILLFDVNPYQVRYTKVLFQLIKSSSSFNAFLSAFFSRTYHKNPISFLQQSYDPSILNKNRQKVDDKEIFDATIGKLARARFSLLGDEIPALYIKNNSMCESLALLNKEIFKPGPQINVIYTHQGIAKNYNLIKKSLPKINILQIGLDDRRIFDFLKSDGLIYTSNIGEDDWLYGTFSDKNSHDIDLLANTMDLSSSFRQQWTASIVGFRSFIRKIKTHFMLMDSSGNLFSSTELLQQRSDSHLWLYQTLVPLVIGKAIEVIHKPQGTWGFKEHFKTINIGTYLGSRRFISYQTSVFHILLGNGVSVAKFQSALKQATTHARRLIILEHDSTSPNFNSHIPQLLSLDQILILIRQLKEFEKAAISVTWSGASEKIDHQLHHQQPNSHRNLIITIDI